MLGRGWGAKDVHLSASDSANLQVPNKKHNQHDAKPSKSRHKMPKIPSDAVDKYFSLQLGLMRLGQHKFDKIMPAKYIKKWNDPDYRLERYQKQVHDQQCGTVEDARRSEWYQYTGLDTGQIRLLHILPGPEESEIECKLVTRSFTEADLAFEALSYTWGDPSIIRHISCNGKALQVTINLWTALNRIRQTSEERIFWIDAVCINQGDTDERSSQVRLMQEIYSRAWGVVVWLGEGGEEVTEAWKLMRRLDEARSKLPANNEEHLWRIDLAEYGLPPADAPEWQTLDALLWRPWFMRIWIVQEITLARMSVVLCANESIPWANFQWMILFLRSRNLEATYNLDVSPAYRLGVLGSAHESGQQLPLLELLALFRRSLATDPHDKVYGLLGLAASHNVEIDYRIPYSQVYLDVAKSLLNESLDVLSHVEDTEWKQGTDMPSWVPNWAVQRYAAPFLTLDQSVRTFEARGNTTPSFRFGPYGRTLVIKGVVLDFVDRVGHRLSASDRIYRPDHKSLSGKPLEAVQPLLYSLETKRRRFCELIVLNLKTYPTGEDIRSVLARLLVLDAKLRVPRFLDGEEEEGGAEEDLDLPKAYSLWRGLFATFPFEKSIIPREGLQRPEGAMAMIYNNGVSWPAAGRRVFTTKGGYAGWGPWGMAKVDTVVLLEGGRTVYILREVSDEGKKVSSKPKMYEFRGEAYVHGLMNGEGFDGVYDSEEIHIV